MIMAFPEYLQKSLIRINWPKGPVALTFTVNIHKDMSTLHFTQKCT